MRSTSTITFLLLLLTGSPIFIQGQTFSIDSNNLMEVFGSYNGAEIHLPAVKKPPVYPGGNNAWQNFLRSNINIKVPVANKALPGNYKVIIRFIVGSDGKLRAIGADTNCGFGMESEIIRCIKKSIDWIPAETPGGRKVTYTLRTMVTFIIKTNDVTISFL